MSSERVVLMMRHEAVLRHLEEALKENNTLQTLLLEQAYQVSMMASWLAVDGLRCFVASQTIAHFQVGALGAAQDALKQQLEAQQQLQTLQGESFQDQVLQLQEKVIL
jgi:hypothetical protein